MKKKKTEKNIIYNNLRNSGFGNTFVYIEALTFFHLAFPLEFAWYATI